MVLFQDALLRLAETSTECTIYTPYGFATGVVDSFDDDLFKFVSNDGQIFTLFVEDLVMLKES